MLSSKYNNSVSIIIVTYNSGDHIDRCLRSLLLHENSYIKEIILIDNASTDDTLKIVSKVKNLKIKVLKQKDNIGFASSVNIGIKKEKGKYILLINPDTEILNECFCNLIKSVEVERGGISGGKMIGKGGLVHNTHVRNPNLLIGLFDFTNLKKIFPNNRWHKKFYYLDSKPISSCMEVDAVSGGFMLINMKVIKNIGYLNENYFMYLEDIEYCKRARDAGFKVMYCSKSVIFHEGGASSQNEDKINFNAWVGSRKYFFWKNHSLLINFIIQPMFFVDELAMRIWRKIK